MRKLLLILLVLTANAAFAQRTVSGLITDKTYQPIEGVMVSIKNCNTKTVTDVAGKYSIEIPENCNTLEFSKEGFKVQVIDITGDVINLTMTSLADVDIFELSLEELMNMEVTTASKTEQKLSDIPASVIIITQGEIQRYGYKDVSDILKHISGMYANDAGMTENFGVRGSFNSAFMRNIAVLINGVNVRISLFDWNFLAAFSIPVEGIDRVEFVRGPMSVMYGNGAFFGALNIITKNGGNANTNIVSVSGGLENSSRVTASSVGQTGDFKYAFNASHYRTDGLDCDYSKITDSIPMLNGKFTKNAKTSKMYDQRLSYFDFSGQFKDFYAGFIISKANIGFTTTTYPVDNESSKFLMNQYNVNFGYKKEISEKFSFDARISLNNDGFSYKNLRMPLLLPGFTLIPNPSPYITHTNSWMSEITSFIKPVKGMDITLGYTYQNIFEMEVFTHIPEFYWNRKNSYLDKPIITHSPYLKAGYWVLDNLLIEAGARFEQRQKYDFVNEIIDPTNVFHADRITYGDDKWNTTYNLATLFKVNDNNSIRAFYGTAINYPAPGEFLTTTKELKSQDIQSGELNYTGLYFSKMSVSLSGFYNKLNNMLIINTDAGGIGTNGNSGKMETKGAELMLTYKPDNKFEMSVAVTYQKTTDKSFKADIDAGVSPNLLATIKTSYSFTKNISVALTGNYVSEMEAVWDPVADKRAGNKVDAYFNLGANVRVENLLVKNLFFNLRATNLLGTDIYYANSYTNLWYKNGLLGQGRYVQATLGYKF